MNISTSISSLCLIYFLLIASSIQSMLPLELLPLFCNPIYEIAVSIRLLMILHYSSASLSSFSILCLIILLQLSHYLRIQECGFLKQYGLSSHVTGVFHTCYIIAEAVPHSLIYFAALYVQYHILHI